MSDNWANSSTTTPLEGQLEGLFFGYDLAFNPYVEDSALVFPIDAKFWLVYIKILLLIGLIILYGL